MSLQFEQIYSIKTSATKVFEVLNEMSENQLDIVSSYSKSDIEDLSSDDLNEIFSSDNKIIYTQHGVTVVQLNSRQSPEKLRIELDILKLSELLDTLVIVIDHYESYYTKLIISEKGNKVMVATSDSEGELCVIKTEDPRFLSMKERLEEIKNLDSSEISEHLYEEGFVFASTPQKVFSELGLVFGGDLYNPDHQNMEELIVFKRQAQS